MSGDSNRRSQIKPEKEPFFGEGLTENDLKEIETRLAKTLTPFQLINAMKILRGFRNGATDKDIENAKVSYRNGFEMCK